MRTFVVFTALLAVAMAAAPFGRRVPAQRPAFQQALFVAPSAPVAPAPIPVAAPSSLSLSTIGKGDQIYILKETPSNNIGLDSYNYAYELSDGQKRDESAQVEVRGPEEAYLRVRGSYSWVNPQDGQTYTITYVADENGFQPQGAHLPVAPHA